jgi:hypothetical protein
MRLVVLKIDESNKKGVFIEADTGMGIIAGLWESKERPEVGEAYDMELGIPEPTEIRVLSSEETHRPGVQVIENNHLRFTALCEEIDYDHSIVLRFAINWMDFASSEGFQCKYQPEFYPQLKIRSRIDEC